jgi:hypothetical protein
LVVGSPAGRGDDEAARLEPARRPTTEQEEPTMAKARAVVVRPAGLYVGVDWAYRRAAWCALSVGGEIVDAVAADEDGLA